jgi:hypothetical protein
MYRKSQEPLLRQQERLLNISEDIYQFNKKFAPFFLFWEIKNTANAIVYGISSSIFNAEDGT